MAPDGRARLLPESSAPSAVAIATSSEADVSPIIGVVGSTAADGPGSASGSAGGSAGGGGSTTGMGGAGGSATGMGGGGSATGMGASSTTSMDTDSPAKTLEGSMGGAT